MCMRYEYSTNTRYVILRNAITVLCAGWLTATSTPGPMILRNLMVCLLRVLWRAIRIHWVLAEC